MKYNYSFLIYLFKFSVHFPILYLSSFIHQNNERQELSLIWLENPKLGNQAYTLYDDKRVSRRALLPFDIYSEYLLRFFNMFINCLVV